jgi:hypothetical protein
VFLYEYSQESLVHFRRLFGDKRGCNEYQNLLSVRPQRSNEIAQMILLDFITRQDDRHLSHFANKGSEQGESFYPLYDNGQSLFCDDSEKIVNRTLSDPAACATSLRPAGTYGDFVQEIAMELSRSDLIDLSTAKAEISDILT